MAFSASPIETNLNLLSTLPVELIDMVLSLLDTTTLFRLCHVSQLFRSLAQPLLFEHASQVTMRLWVCQPGLLAHKPIDFGWSHCDQVAHQMVFSPLDPSAATLTLQKSLPPPRIDGCTVLIKVGSAKRIYSISYKHRVIPVPVDSTSAAYSRVTLCGQQEEEEAYYGCAWKFTYAIRDTSPSCRQLIPSAFTCDVDLLDPYILTSPASRDMVIDVTGPEHRCPPKPQACQQDLLPPFWASRIWDDAKSIARPAENI
ncbi:hypothetical protein BX666DRAFT_2030993 [Dichotomocladium elegans]|nr:hypothetical protein BX666DRAFT_2030993 [Dichotomocladium elegans]